MRSDLFVWVFAVKHISSCVCPSTFEHLITRSYYRCNSFGDILHSTHGIGGTRKIVVYACPNTNRLCVRKWGNCYTDTDHEDGYLDESTHVDDGSGDFYAKVTYSVKQLTADYVDETSVHHGFNVDNDYKHPVPYSITSCIDVCIGYRGNIPTTFFILAGIEINEQLSRRNSLNAFCYRLNCVNWVFSQNWHLYDWNWT